MFDLIMENAKPTILILTSPDKYYIMDTLNAKVHLHVSRQIYFFLSHLIQWSVLHTVREPLTSEITESIDRLSLILLVHF